QYRKRFVYTWLLLFVLAAHPGDCQRPVGPPGLCLSDCTRSTRNSSTAGNSASRVALDRDSRALSLRVARIICHCQKCQVAAGKTDRREQSLMNALPV